MKIKHIGVDMHEVKHPKHGTTLSRDTDLIRVGDVVKKV